MPIDSNYKFTSNIGVIYGSVVSYGKIQLKRIGPKRHGSFECKLCTAKNIIVWRLINVWRPLYCFFKKWANPGLFFIYFRSFQTNNTTFTTNQCEKCPSSIWSWDLNPQPFIHESSPITTRPGLPPYFVKLGSYYLLPIGLLLRIYLRLR